MNGCAQLPLELPTAPRYGRDDWLVADANRHASTMIDRWPEWPDRALLVSGPAGAGKTHLARIWAERAGAALYEGVHLPTLETLAAMPQSAIVVDDAHLLSDERALFHIFNLVTERGGHLLLTARAGDFWREVRLPDLASRLRRATAVALAAPDDALIHAVLDKLFRDRQLVVEAPALAYAALRLDRSLDAARAFVAAVDRAALSQARPVTRALTAQVMQDFLRR